MMKSTTIRMDDDLKREASAKLEALGLNFNTYVVMATKQLVAQNRIPFDLVVPETSGKDGEEEYRMREDVEFVRKYKGENG